jgi:hypothetical protein
MGLDMYMFKTNKELPEFSKGDASTEYFEEVEATSQVEVAYWRKFNALHSWFVENVQGGVDECQAAEVQVGDVEELIDLLEESLETKEPTLIPVGGFFFGSTDVDEYYWDDVKNTLDKFNEILDDLKEEEFLYYQSSW